MSDLLRAVAADHDERINAHLLGVVDDLVGDVLHRAIGHLVIERVATIGGAQDRSTSRQDPAHVLQLQHARLLRPDQAIKAVLDPDDLPFVLEDCRLNGRADDCVEAGAIAAASGDAYRFDLAVSHCDCAIVANRNLIRMSGCLATIPSPYNAVTLRRKFLTLTRKTLFFVCYWPQPLFATTRMMFANRVSAPMN